MPDTCETCCFWMKPPSGMRSADGTCHRYPPQMLVLPHGRMIEPQAEWPRVSRYQWCGEHRSSAENAGATNVTHSGENDDE